MQSQFSSMNQLSRLGVEDHLIDYVNFIISFAFPFLIAISFSSCTSRYVGEYCQNLNPCYTSSGPRCQNGGNCTVSYHGGVPVFRCNCPIGFTASLCEIREQSACDSSPCQNGGSCILKSLSDYVCSCAQGYTGKRAGLGPRRSERSERGREQKKKYVKYALCVYVLRRDLH